MFKHSSAMGTLELYLICKSASSVNHQIEQKFYKNYFQHLKFIRVYYCNLGEYYALMLNNLCLRVIEVSYMENHIQWGVFTGYLIFFSWKKETGIMLTVSNTCIYISE